VSVKMCLLVFLLINVAIGFVFQGRTRTKINTFRCSTMSKENYSAKITSSKSILYRAVETKAEKSDDVVAALLELEKAARERARNEPTSSTELTQKLNGAWRLVFTTGTIDTQKMTGRINYFPIKAVQSFDFEEMRITNGIYFGDFAALKFFGFFNFDLKSRKLTFDFDRIELFNGGLGFDLKQGEAASLGAKAGLGAKNNEKLVKEGKKPFFNWIDADDSIACARGGGGGLAIWSRIES